MTRLLAIASIAIGLLGLTAAYLVWSDYQNQFHQISSDIAQMKLSVQLLAQRTPGAGETKDAGTSDDAAAFEELRSRIGALEAALGNSAQLASNALSGVPLPTSRPEDAPGSAVGGDCIPAGTRFLLTPGDKYAICGTQESLTLQEVGEGIAKVAEVGSLTQGGLTKLGASACNVTLVSTMADAGFAEVRVNC